MTNTELVQAVKDELGIVYKLANLISCKNIRPCFGGWMKIAIQYDGNLVRTITLIKWN